MVLIPRFKIYSEIHKNKKLPVTTEVISQKSDHPIYHNFLNNTIVQNKPNSQEILITP